MSITSEIDAHLPDSIGGLLHRMVAELTCPICLSLLSDSTATPCGHMYCRQCILNSLQSKNAKCPICKHDITKRQLYAASSVEAITKEIRCMQNVYEEQVGHALSQEPLQVWRTDPLSDLSQRYPHPTKPSSDSTYQSNDTGAQEPIPSFLCEETKNSAAVQPHFTSTYDSDTTFVTSLEIQQANESRNALQVDNIHIQQQHCEPTSTAEIMRDEEGHNAQTVNSPPLLHHSIVTRACIFIPGFASEKAHHEVTLISNNILNTKIVGKISKHVSHIIFPQEDSPRQTKRRMLFMLAVLFGSYLVSEAWLTECCVHGSLVTEEPYETTGDKSIGSVNTLRRARESLKRGEPKLFINTTAYFMSEGHRPYKKTELQSLFESGGGQIVESYDQLPINGLLLCASCTTNSEAQKVLEQQGQMPTSSRWIIDCICRYERLDTTPYHLDSPQAS